MTANEFRDWIDQMQRQEWEHLEIKTRQRVIRELATQLDPQGYDAPLSFMSLYVLRLATSKVWNEQTQLHFEHEKE